MRKVIPAFIFLIIMLSLLVVALFNIDKIDQAVIKREVQATTSKPEPPKDRIISCQVTGFCQYGWSANGYDFGPGLAIVDPAVIPIGSYIYIENYGDAQAIETSPDVKGNQIKVWFQSPSQARNFGTQTLKVKVMEGQLDGLTNKASEVQNPVNTD